METTKILDIAENEIKVGDNGYRAGNKSLVKVEIVNIKPNKRCSIGVRSHNRWGNKKGKIGYTYPSRILILNK